MSDKYWRSVNLFYSKTYTRGTFKTQSNVYNKAFLWFSQRCSTVDVQLGSKYGSAYIYIQLSPIEIILHIILNIFNIFAVQYLFLTKEEWDKVALKEKEIKGNFLSLHYRIQFLWFIHSKWHLRIKPDAKYLTYFLVVLKRVLRETKTVIMILPRTQFLFKCRIISWWIYDGVCFKQIFRTSLEDYFCV